MASYIAIRDLDLVAADGRPVLPPTWDVQEVQTTPAPTWIARRPAGDIFLVTKCNEAGGRGLFLIRGDRAFLDSLDNAEVAPAREVYRKALAGPGTARNVMRAWRWWRCDVTERATQADVDAGDAAQVGDPIQRDGVLRELTAEGVLLPDPGSTAFPWDLDADGNVIAPEVAAIRVRALVRPVLAPGGVAWTMAGAADHEAAESEPDREV